jgi:hypothetical protein
MLGTLRWATCRYWRSGEPSRVGTDEGVSHQGMSTSVQPAIAGQVALHGGGSLAAAPARMTRVAWAPSRAIEYAEWASMGRRLGGITRCSQWWLGDWIRYGNARYGEKYARAAALTGYDVQSLRNMAYVASSFGDPSRRRDRLSWSHHECLASLSADQQDRWLDRSEAERLSVADLRLELRGRRRRRTCELDAAGLVCPTCGQSVDAVSGAGA